MGRLKVAMEPFKNAKKRNQRFETRKKDIIKKANELTTLCDVNVSMIICADDQKPEIFPPDLHEFTSLANLYSQNRRIMDPAKIQYYSVSDFFKEKTTMKVEQELAIVKRKNTEAKYPTWFDSFNNLSEVQLREIASRLQNKIRDVKDKVESFNISKTHNQDNDSIYPSSTTVVNVESPSILSSSNPSSPDEDLDKFSLELEEMLRDESNEFSLQENDSICPSPTTVLNVKNPWILSSSNPSSPDEDLDKFSLELEEMLRDESNEFSLQDNDPICPSPTTVLNVKNPSVLSSSNLSSPDEDFDQFSLDLEVLLGEESNEFSLPYSQPEPPSFSDQNNLPIQSSNRDSFMKLPTHNHSYNHKYYSSLQPTPSCFSPEIPIIPQQPPLSCKNIWNDPNSKMKQQMCESDFEGFIDEYFSLQPEIPHPTPTYRFQQEIPKKPELPPFSDQNNESKQSWNIDSMTDLLMNDDDNDNCDHGNFSLQHPIPAHSFPREIQQPAPAATVYIID